MDSPTHLLGLPNEIILYILRQFLDLDDIWGLLQVSRQLRYFAMDTIHKRWKIDPLFTPATILKIQCRASLIALERLSAQLPVQHDQQEYNTIFTGYDEMPTPTSPSLAMQPHSAITSSSTSVASTTTTTTTTLVRPAHDNGSRHHADDDDDEDDDDSEAMEDLYHAAMTMRSAGLDIGASVPLAPGTPLPSFYPPPSPSTTTATATTAAATASIHIHEFLLTTIDCGTITHHSSALDLILLKEKRLHHRMIRGITACKHKYVLIEDIDIRNRIRATVDIVFHHAVFVSAITRQDQQQQQQRSPSSHDRNVAVMMVRLLIRLDAAFPSYCREITYTLVDHIKAFLEYTGYKLLYQRSRCTHGRELLLHPLVFGSPEDVPSTSSSIPANVMTPGLSPSQYAKVTSPVTTTSGSRQTYTTPTCSLLPTLYSIAACFDLMGAAFIGKIIGETHVECAVQRVCELLTDDARHDVGAIKKAFLVDLLEGWLTCKRGLMASDLCRFVQSEIDRC